MGVLHFKNTDPGALVLSGQVGSLIAILDIVLVALGWTIAFTGTNKRAYRMNNVSQSGRYLRVDDSNARYAIVNAFHSMTDVDTGTGGFPAIATPRYWIKSDATSSAARPWAIYGDEGFIHAFLGWHSVYTFEYYAFGDLVDCPPTPGQVTFFMGNPSNAPSYPGATFNSYRSINNFTNVTSTHLMPNAAGSFTGIEGQLVGHVMMGSSLGRGGGIAPTGAAEANGVSMRASPVDVIHIPGAANVNNWWAGRLPGLLAPWSRLSDTLTGTVLDDFVDGEGHDYRFQRIYDGSGGADNYSVPIDIEGPWRG